MQDCAVCECDPEEIPICWQDEREAFFEYETLAAGAPAKQSAPQQVTNIDDELSKVTIREEGPGISPHVAGWSLSAGEGGGSSGGAAFNAGDVWGTGTSAFNPFEVYSPKSNTELPMKETNPEAGNPMYVNFLDNPEGYTGYGGEEARKIWRAIYGEGQAEETCSFPTLHSDGSPCLEERVFNRLLSGLQASINTHIALTYNQGMGLIGGREKSVFTEPWTLELLRAKLLQHGGLLQFLPDFISEPLYHWWSHIRGSPHPIVPVNRKLWDHDPRMSYVLTPSVTPSLDMFAERVGQHPERLQNLYFVFLFISRALSKARPAFEAGTYEIGDGIRDFRTKQQVLDLLEVADRGEGGTKDLFILGEEHSQQPQHDVSFNPSILASVLDGFNETAMFKVSPLELLSDPTCPVVLHGLADLHELQRRYQAAATKKAAMLDVYRAKYLHITRVLDCIGCEKCKLWGKTQFLGIGTALKVLFAENEGEESTGELKLHLSRNEVVALVNLMHRLSISVGAVHILDDLESYVSLEVFVIYTVFALIVLSTVSFLMSHWLRNKRMEKSVKLN